MGCWNATCMVSHLPIVAGENCAIVVLLERAKNHVLDSACYPNHTLVPIYILRGKYNEYGWLEEIQDGEKFITFINKLNLVSYEDHEPIKITSFDMFLENIHENNLVAVQISGVTREKAYLQVRTVFVKESVLDMSRDFWENPEDHWDKESYNRVKNYFETAIELQKKANEDKKYSDKAFWAASDMFQLMSMSYPCIEYSMFFQECFRTDPEFIGKMFYEILYLDSTLDWLRMSWHIPSGAGSQNCINRLNHAFLELYKTEVEKLEYDEDE